MSDNVFFMQSDISGYPEVDSLFRPSTVYPEYPFSNDISPKMNSAYELFRNTLILARLDIENVETPNWNPFGKYITPNDTVLIKPNLVMDRNENGEGTDCLYTHPSLIAAAIDYVIIALKAKGKIFVGDAPMQECDFDNLIEQSGLKALIQYYKKKGIDISLIDFRGLKSKNVNGIYHQELQNEDGTIIDLGKDSEFADFEERDLKNLRITNYSPALLREHHNRQKHEYYVSNYLLKADVVINMPKPKTHRKAGITGALKNMVGINVRKEFLPHHTLGSKESSKGDEYLKTSCLKYWSSVVKDKQNVYISSKRYFCAQIAKHISRVFFYADRLLNKDHFSQGSWYGNETISRTICDLNKILLYADKSGMMQDVVQRRVLIIADMIIMGEKEGPVLPSPKTVGIIGLSSDPVFFDECLAAVMGVNPNDIPTIRFAKAIKNKKKLYHDDDKAAIVSNNPAWNNKLPDEIEKESSLMLIPTSGWRHVFYATEHLS